MRCGHCGRAANHGIVLIQRNRYAEFTASAAAIDLQSFCPDIDVMGAAELDVRVASAIFHRDAGAADLYTSLAAAPAECVRRIITVRQVCMVVRSIFFRGLFHRGTGNGHTAHCAAVRDDIFYGE